MNLIKRELLKEIKEHLNKPEITVIIGRDKVEKLH